MIQEYDDAEYGRIFDPRDHMLGDFIYSDPEPVSAVRMIGQDFCWMDPGLEQLLVAEMISYGWLVENENGSISLTNTGRLYGTARLFKGPGWAQDGIIPGAPPLPEMSSRLSVAYRASIARYPDNPLWKAFGEQWDA